MNRSTVLFLVDDTLKAIEVSYDDDNSRNNNRVIKKTKMTDLKVGDYVLVETNNRHNATVCKVKRVDVQIDFDSDEEVGWVFAKVDMDHLKRLKVLEGQALHLIEEADRRERKQKLRDTIAAQCGAELLALTSSIDKIDPDEE